MVKLALVAIFPLVASGLSRGQTIGPTPAVKSGPATANESSQTDNRTGEIPTFHSQVQQVLVTVAVWKNAPRTTAWVPRNVVKERPDLADSMAMLPIASGLSASDFHVFDNGAEQRINYLEESDLPMRNASKQWFFYPQSRGTWGTSFDFIFGLTAPIATYTIGFTPAISQSGDCHTIRVVAGDNLVITNRDHYCTSDEGDPATAEESKLATQMEQFSKSGKRGAFKVSSRPFVFWSSRVLSLMRDNPSGFGPAAAPDAAHDTFLVVVHDSRAPAIVQIATEYELGMKYVKTDSLGTKYWNYPCPHDAAIHVLGTVYKANGEVATQFGDSYSCRNGGSSSQTLMDYGYDPPEGSKFSKDGVLIPTRFDSQVELLPGEYDVHVVVSDGSKFGQARIPLRVVPLDGRALTISDVALNGILRDTSWLLHDAALVSPAPLMPTPLVSKHAQFIPVPDSRIPKKTSLPIYFEIYEPLLATQSPEVYFRMKITNLKDNTVVMNTEPTSAAQCVTPGNVVVPIALNVDTDKLPSGEYKLEVQASDSAGRTSEWRMAKFEVQ